MTSLGCDVEALRLITDSFQSTACAKINLSRKIKWCRNRKAVLYHRDRIRQHRASLSEAVQLFQPFLTWVLAFPFVYVIFRRLLTR